MGKKKRNTKPEAQCQGFNIQENAVAQTEIASLPPTVPIDSKLSESVGVLEPPVSQHEFNCSSTKKDAEEVCPVSEQGNHTVNAVSSSLQNQLKDKTLGPHLAIENIGEATHENQSEHGFETKNKKGRRHKNKKGRQEKVNDCDISTNLKNGEINSSESVCVLKPPVSQHENNCSSTKKDAEEVCSVSEQGNHTVNAVSSSLQNQLKDKTLGPHLAIENMGEATHENQSEQGFETKNKKGRRHKNKKGRQEKVNECEISTNLKNGEINSKTNTEREKIEDTSINCVPHNNETHLESRMSRKRRTKKGNKKETDSHVSEIQESKKENTSNEKKNLNTNDILKHDGPSEHKEALSEPLEKPLKIKPEPTTQIMLHSEASQHEVQDKPKNQGSSISNVRRSLSQEQIANITKTAVNLSQSLGENEKSKISFTPELMQSLLSPAPKDITTQENELEYKVIQRQIFLNNACHVCKTIQCASCILKRCNNCKMISYCSKEHQKEHWPIHKDLCKAISKVNKLEGMTHLCQKAIGLTPDEYRHYRIHYINICANILGRELELWEKEMFFFAQVCHTCYEFQVNKLKVCENCNTACYCEPDHFKADHETWCNDLQIYRDLVVYQFHNGMIQPSSSQLIHKKYIPLNGEMSSFLLNTCTGANDRLQYVVLTELATCPLSALFALQQSNFPLETASSLIIHIVGAELHFEGNALNKWEAFMLHLLPSIIILHIVFIGPELQLDNALSNCIKKYVSCSECTKTGKSLTFSFWSGYYHDYVLSDQYQKPNLITAFNDGLYRTTGFQSEDSWLPSLQVMLRDATIPLIVTEYTSQELPLDIKRMEKICPLNIIVPPSKNPFSSAKPSLNFLSDEIVPVIFKNYYITVLHRKYDTECSK